MAQHRTSGKGRSGQLRDASGRFANPMAQTLHKLWRIVRERNNDEIHRRRMFTMEKPLSWFDDPVAGVGSGEIGMFAVALRAVIKRPSGLPPERAIEVEYVDESRTRRVVREVPGRLDCDGSDAGAVHVSSFDPTETPRAIAVEGDSEEVERLEDHDDADEKAMTLYREALDVHCRMMRAERAEDGEE